MLPLTRPVEYRDVVGGELVLAAHADEQGAASPVGGHRVTTLGAQRFIALTRDLRGLILQHSN